MSAPLVRVVRLGRLGYEPALRRQLREVARVKAAPADHAIILVEHEPVYTTGIREERGTRRAHRAVNYLLN